MLRPHNNRLQAFRIKRQLVKAPQNRADRLEAVWQRWVAIRLDGYLSDHEAPLLFELEHVTLHGRGMQGGCRTESACGSPVKARNHIDRAQGCRSVSRGRTCLPCCLHQARKSGLLSIRIVAHAYQSCGLNRRKRSTFENEGESGSSPSVQGPMLNAHFAFGL